MSYEIQESGDIIVFNMSPYTDWVKGVRNRNFFIVREIAKKYPDKKLFLIDFTPHTIKRGVRTIINHLSNTSLFEQEGRAGWHTLLLRVKKPLFERSAPVYVLTSIAPLWSENTFYESCKKLVFGVGYTKGIVWSYNPLVGSSFIDFPATCHVFDAVDDWTAHPSLYQAKERLEKGYAHIAQHTHTIFTVSTYMQRFFEQRGRTKNVVPIPNGVDTALFESRKEPISIPHDLKDIPEPRVLYVGNIQARFDTELAAQVAQQLPQVSFVYIGDVWKEVRHDIMEKLGSLKNVYFLGRKDYNELPLYFAHARIGLLTHKRTPLMDSMDPMKLYDYFAAGLPVISTPFPSLPSVLAPYIRIGKDARDFVRHLQQLLAKSSEKHTLPQHILEAIDWKQRFQDMQKIIKHVT